MAEHLIGVDLGGTNMRVGLVTGDGEVRTRLSEPTRMDSDDGPAILRRMAGMVERIRKEHSIPAEAIAGMGVGIPGPLAPEIGGANPPNLTQLSGLPIVRILEEATGLRVALENDANAAAWGEYWIGAGRGCRSMILATLGTGIGGGLILDGRIHRGPDHTAGELGHVVVVDGGRPCACGSNGCIEAYASANSTVRRFVEALEKGLRSPLAEGPREEITCRAIFEAAAGGDRLALSLVQETGRLLGVLAANMANLLNPERFVFSGGMIEAGDLLFGAIREECARRAFAVPDKRMDILPARLGGDAGLIGAAGCARNTFATSP